VFNILCLICIQSLWWITYIQQWFHMNAYFCVFSCVFSLVWKTLHAIKKPLRKERRYKSNSDCYHQGRMINRSIQQYVPKFLLETLKWTIQKDKTAGLLVKLQTSTFRLQKLHDFVPSFFLTEKLHSSSFQF
jgi:hypothetical protein